MNAMKTQIFHKMTYDFISHFYAMGPNTFGIVVSHPNLDVEVSGSSQCHINDFKNGTYCFLACDGHNELKSGECISHKKVQLIPYIIYKFKELVV